MKNLFKINWIIILSLLVYLTNDIKAQQNNEIPVEFKDYISKISVSTEYKTIYSATLEELITETYRPCPDSISQKQALEDIQQFEYLLETAYSGREYWEKQGCDFNEIYSKAEEFVKSKKEFSVLELETFLSSLLKGKIVDAHFYLRGHKLHTFSQHKNVYYTDILLKRNMNGKYIVIDSKVESVKKGDEFDEKEKEHYLFKTLSPKNEQHYLLGILSYENMTEENLSFDGQIKNIPFHISRLTKTKLKNEPAFRVDTVEEIPIVTVASFDMNDENIPNLTNFEQYGIKLQNKDLFILNLFNNNGGSSLYPMNFIKNLNTEVNSNGIGAYLRSPSLSQLFAGINIDAYPDLSKQPGMDVFIKEVNIQKGLLENYKINPKREWEINIDKEVNKKSSGTYNGEMVVLMNRGVSSSAETAIKFCKTVKDVILIGENTSGVGTFSNVLRFYLSNSNICIHMGYQISLMPGFRETIGFIPDYWLDTDQPIEEIIKWLNNPDSYQFNFK